MGRIRDIHSGTAGSDWKGMRWQISLLLDSRANCYQVKGTAIHQRHPLAEPTYGHAQKDVGPFDSVQEAVDYVTVEAALMTVVRNEAEWSQERLWD